jgi:hypothetical protein
MVIKKPTPTMAQKSSNSRAEAITASMSGAKKVTDKSNTNKKGKNTMATKKASAKKMMAKPAQAAPKAAGMTAAQKKLPAFIQKSIMAKNKAKKK